NEQRAVGDSAPSRLLVSVPETRHPKRRSGSRGNARLRATPNGLRRSRESARAARASAHPAARRVRHSPRPRQSTRRDRRSWAGLYLSGDTTQAHPLIELTVTQEEATQVAILAVDCQLGAQVSAAKRMRLRDPRSRARVLLSHALPHDPRSRATVGRVRALAARAALHGTRPRPRATCLVPRTSRAAAAAHVRSLRAYRHARRRTRPTLDRRESRSSPRAAPDAPETAARMRRVVPAQSWSSGAYRARLPIEHSRRALEWAASHRPSDGASGSRSPRHSRVAEIPTHPRIARARPAAQPRSYPGGISHRAWLAQPRRPYCRHPRRRSASPYRMLLATPPTAARAAEFALHPPGTSRRCAKRPSLVQRARFASVSA